jgi:hypothetical protein
MRGKLAAILITAALTGCTAFYAGGVVGFGKGYLAAVFAASDGTGPTVSMLRRLREGDPAPVVDALETQLDGLIIQNGVGPEAYGSIFNLTRLVGVGDAQAVDRSARAALKYRAEFPSVMPADAKAEVDAALAKLAKRTTGKG